MSDKTRAVLAIDIGGSKFIVGFVNNCGKVLHSRREEWIEPGSGEHIINQLMTAIRQELKQNPQYDVAAVGMTAPGFTDPQKGILVSMSLGDIHNWAVAELFRKDFGLQAFINNDAKACALAEMWFGSCRDCDDFLYITASTGIGGAFVLDGKLYNGAFGRAGEVGNAFLFENGRENGRGRLGTVEMYASTRGMAMNYLELGGSPPCTGNPIDGKYISEQASKGDPAALKTLELEGKLLGTLIAQACNLLDLERVVIGGGISLAFHQYKESLEKTLWEQKYWRDKEFSVIPTVLGYEGALVGAATLAYLGIGEPLTRPGAARHEIR